MTDQLDPIHSTALDLNRKAFIGMSAGAIAATSTIAAALAAGEDLGKPHPPIVSRLLDRISRSRHTRRIRKTPPT